MTIPQTVTRCCLFGEVGMGWIMVRLHAGRSALPPWPARVCSADLLWPVHLRGSDRTGNVLRVGLLGLAGPGVLTCGARLSRHACLAEPGPGSHAPVDLWTGSENRCSRRTTGSARRAHKWTRLQVLPCRARGSHCQSPRSHAMHALTRCSLSHCRHTLSAPAAPRLSWGAASSAVNLAPPSSPGNRGCERMLEGVGRWEVGAAPSQPLSPLRWAEEPHLRPAEVKGRGGESWAGPGSPAPRLELWGERRGRGAHDRPLGPGFPSLAWVPGLGHPAGQLFLFSVEETRQIPTQGRSRICTQTPPSPHPCPPCSKLHSLEGGFRVPVPASAHGRLWLKRGPSALQPALFAEPPLSDASGTRTVRK